MKRPTAADLDPVISETWPAKTQEDIGPFTVRFGGGGQRARAATCFGSANVQDICAVERATQNTGETLFRVRGWETDLDALLAVRGYEKRDPTNLLVGPVAPVAGRELPRVTAFSIWPPLAIMEELWAANDVGADRRANMDRVVGEKTALFGRGSDQPGGVGFAALGLADRQNIAMIHAVAVSPHLRRQKIAENMMVLAGKWAQDMGADWLATLCTCQNSAALSLYEKLGLEVVGTYHYRAKKAAN